MPQHYVTYTAAEIAGYLTEHDFKVTETSEADFDGDGEVKLGIEGRDLYIQVGEGYLSLNEWKEDEGAIYHAPTCGLFDGILAQLIKVKAGAELKDLHSKR